MFFTFGKCAVRVYYNKFAELLISVLRTGMNMEYLPQ